MEKNIKTQIVSYLTKTSNHTFIKPKATFKWGNETKAGYYEYDYENFTYFKVFKNGDEFTYLENGRLNKIDIDYYIKYWGNNAKDVISKILFLDKKMISVRKNDFIINI
jgi:hypothetical protein